MSSVSRVLYWANANAYYPCQTKAAEAFEPLMAPWKVTNWQSYQETLYQIQEKYPDKTFPEIVHEVLEVQQPPETQLRIWKYAQSTAIFSTAELTAFLKASVIAVHNNFAKQDLINSEGMAHQHQIIRHKAFNELAIIGFDHDDYEDDCKYWVNETITPEAIRKVYA